MRVLLVEDNQDLAAGLCQALAQDGYAVDHLDDGAEAEALLAAQPYDALVLDLSLPGMDGLEVLARYRNRGGNAPVLILTARGDLPDRITGLDRGADDYLVKPFDLAELQARLRALLRRASSARSAELRCGALLLDQAGRRASLDGRPLDLPRRELSVLEILLLRAGRVVSKDQIAEHLFGFDDEAGPNAVELYIHRLRKKLGPDAPRIRTIRGLGYLLEDLPKG